MLIMMTGNAYSGKTTAALHLVRQHGFVRLSFAKPLKDMIGALDVPHEYIYGGLKDTPCPELGGLTFRHGAQTLGTDWGRKLMHPDFWVWMMERLLNNRYEGCDVVIDDGRFLNEAAMVRKRKGLIWRIWNDGIEDTVKKHESELELEQIDYDKKIINNGTREHLYATLDRELPT